ncbi:hypothetical protein G7Z12_27070 [Streptomyces sp. ID38640]|nr:hypothetical protein G7Z12_27070 [Streptomyces sp. ID38640]
MVSIKNNLAGKEHVAAVLAVLVLCGLCELWRRHRPGDAGGVSGSAHPR